ncbi:hypothetical protein X798_07902 [Onchocerca flexuosa]|uniref:DUF7774 domain-containing protein n=1 Tax=Onchocerca flexuosa TaxID=387005 RepID=A0A238BKN4_9BILA|nr:hypothetical protein X798_07902 [Onchocerca flexuosa]
MSESNIPEKRKGLTEKELSQLRTRFKRRQNKFAAITAAATPADAHDEDEIFEGVDAEINPIIDEKNEEFCFSRKVKLGKDAICRIRGQFRSGTVHYVNKALPQKPLLTNKDSTNILSRQKSPIKAKKIPQSSSTSSKSDSTSKSKISSPEISQGIVSTVAVKKRESRSKDSVSISSSESKTDKIKRIESGSKTSCGIESKKATETSGKYELKSETLSNKIFAFLLQYQQSPQSISNIDLLPIEMMKKDQLLYEKMEDDIVLDTNVLQSLATDLTTQSNKVNKDVIGEDIAKKLIEIEKKDQSSTEQDHIKEEKEIVISEIARKIVEALTSNHVLGKVLTPEEAAILKDYFSQKIPLSEKVLATLDTALDKILSRAHEFYDDKKELDAFLKDRDSAKAKLLDALIAKKSNYLADLMTDASYYADRISKGLIDAYRLATEGILVARDNLQYMQAAVGQTYRYSKDMAYRGAALTYETATRSKKLAELGASVGAQMTYDAAKMTLDAAIRGKELAEQSAAIGTKMTLDAAMRGKEFAERSAAIGTKITLDAAIRGKELAELGTKMTSDAAKVTYDVTTRSKELAELGVAIGAKITQDAASKGLEIVEGTIQTASKGKEMVKDSLTAASSATRNLSEAALESAVQATELEAYVPDTVGKKVENLTSAMGQARSEIQKSSEWLLSFFEPSMTFKTSEMKEIVTAEECKTKQDEQSKKVGGGISEMEDSEDDSSDNDDENGTSLSPTRKVK